MEQIKRSTAVRTKLSRYFTGKPCKWGHISERFTTNGVCVQCNEENNIRRAGSGKLTGKELGELLTRGGPTSEAEARTAGLQWFVRKTRCGCDIVALDGVTCLTCGSVTPMVVPSAEELLA